MPDLGTVMPNMDMTPQMRRVDPIDTSLEHVEKIANHRHIANGRQAAPAVRRGYITAPRLSSRRDRQEAHAAPVSGVVHANLDVHDVCEHRTIRERGDTVFGDEDG